MKSRLLAYAIVILSVVYFYSSEHFIQELDTPSKSSKALEDDTKDVYLSCSLPPLDIKVMKDWSIVATNDIDDLEDDYRKVFTGIEGTHEGTGVCGGYSWIIDYMDTNYQVSEIGCYPGNNYHVPEKATAQLTVGGDIVDNGYGQIMENGSVFWCY